MTELWRIPVSDLIVWLCGPSKESRFRVGALETAAFLSGLLSAAETKENGELSPKRSTMKAVRPGRFMSIT
jgi:hypothetical protein